MPKSSGELADQIEGEYEPENYEDYEDLISDIKNKYGSGIIPNLSFSEEAFIEEEIEEEEEEIDDNSSNDREITTSAIAPSNETSSGISKAVRGFLGRFRL